MNQSDKGLQQLRLDIIISAKRGYPILLSGALYFIALGLLPSILAPGVLHLVWVMGLCVIFPGGILIGKLLGIEVITKGNPLGTLGGIVAGMQGLFLPVFILIYQLSPELLPFTIGILGGAHFLPYVWIYDSKAYGFVTMATVVLSFMLGRNLDQAFVQVPFAIAAVYLIASLWLIRENQATEKRYARQLAQ